MLSISKLTMAVKGLYALVVLLVIFIIALIATKELLRRYSDEATQLHGEDSLAHTNYLLRDIENIYFLDDKDELKTRAPSVPKQHVHATEIETRREKFALDASSPETISKIHRKQELSLREDLLRRTRSCNTETTRFVEALKERDPISAEIITHVNACGIQARSQFPHCIPRFEAFHGSRPPNMSRTSMLEVRRSKVLAFVNHGGWIYPSGCQPKHNIALIIPFRNREAHLPILLRQLFPIVHRRNDVHMRVFVIDQVDGDDFNRGKTRNIGFLEALKLFPYTCFIFHDIDLIPEDDRIPYDCYQTPTHLSVAIDKLNYTLPYRRIFGGVQMVTREQYEEANGFANTFWEWGGEDDNFFQRLIKLKNYRLMRPPADIARYKAIKHDHKRTNYKDPVIIRPYVNYAKLLYTVDGLNNMNYEVVEIIEHEFYTRIKVNTKKQESPFNTDFLRYFRDQFGNVENKKLRLQALRKQEKSKGKKISAMRQSELIKTGVKNRSRNSSATSRAH